MTRTPGALSPTARCLELIIRNARARKGGTRECGRKYLARRLDRSPRAVSRYVAELRRAGRLEVRPPAKVRTSRGWRSVGFNTYRMTQPSHPAPHIRRSGRGDTVGTPPLTGMGTAARYGQAGAVHPVHARDVAPYIPPPDDESIRARGIAALRAALVG